MNYINLKLKTVFVKNRQQNSINLVKTNFYSIFVAMKIKSSVSMFSKAQRIIAAKVCFFVFFMKMLISATPMFVDVLDKGTILQVVLQLEVENTANNSNANNEDLHEHGVKIFKPDAIDFLVYNPSIENTGKQKSYLKNEKSICSFHPSVPTPPPNC